MEIRPLILSQNPFQLAPTAARGWFSTLGKVARAFFTWCQPSAPPHFPRAEPSCLLIGCLKYHSSKVYNLAYSEHSYLGGHLQAGWKGAILGNSEARMKT